MAHVRYVDNRDVQATDERGVVHERAAAWVHFEIGASLYSLAGRYVELQFAH